MRGLLKDLHESCLLWRLWVYLGWEEISRQYRRSFLGPIWVALNTGLFIFSFAFIWAKIFNQNISDYLPYVATGHVFYSFINSSILDSCSVFISSEAYIKQIPTPKLGFVFRMILRNLIILGHNLVVLAVVYIWAGISLNAGVFVVIGALLATCVNAVFVGAYLGVICARFRDVPMIVANALQILFFVTPVLWKPSQIGAEARAIVDLNPVAVFLQLLRDPLLNIPLTSHLWMSLAVITGINALIFLVVFSKYRSKIVFWL